ncbi:MAG: hypothetical protein OXH75_14705 [Acidobacteria bacterium]|nr:hypothetical protein [Acidobacteriota bacterium]
MTRIEQNEATVKKVFKEALVETLYEHRGLLREALADALEEVGLTEAIRQGWGTESVTRDTALRALDVGE